jgi:hypothetical protein
LESYAGEKVHAPRSIEVLGPLKIDAHYSAILSGACVVGGRFTGDKLRDVVVSPQTDLRDDIAMSSCENVVFPPRMHVRGNFILKGGKNIVLPAELVVDGDLDISGCLGITAPEALTVGKRLLAQNCDLVSFGPTMRVLGSAFLGDMDNLERLPSSMEVGENLMLRNSPVRDIHDGVSVGGALSIDERLLGGLTVADGARLGKGIQSRQRNGGFVAVDPDTLRPSRRDFAA